MSPGFCDACPVISAGATWFIDRSWRILFGNLSFKQLAFHSSEQSYSSWIRKWVQISFLWEHFCFVYTDSRKSTRIPYWWPLEICSESLRETILCGRGCSLGCQLGDGQLIATELLFLCLSCALVLCWRIVRVCPFLNSVSWASNSDSSSGLTRSTFWLIVVLPIFLLFTIFWIQFAVAQFY